MSRLKWHLDRSFDCGLDRGVLFETPEPGISWSGLTSVQETPSDESTSQRYLLGNKRIDKKRPIDFGLSVAAYTYPDILDGKIKEYAGFCYRVQKSGRDQIHLVYNTTFNPDESVYSTLTSDTEAINFSWEVTTRPRKIKGYAPSSHLIIDIADEIGDLLREEVFNLLYGTDDTDPQLPDPNDLVDLFDASQYGKTFLVIDHGDGLWTAIGPSDMIEMTSATSFEIDSPTAIFGGEYWYTVESF